MHQVCHWYPWWSSMNAALHGYTRRIWMQQFCFCATTIQLIMCSTTSQKQQQLSLHQKRIIDSPFDLFLFYSQMHQKISIDTEENYTNQNLKQIVRLWSYYVICNYQWSICRKKNAMMMWIQSFTYQFKMMNSLVICWLQPNMHEKEEKNQLWTTISQNQNLKNCSVICYAMHSHEYDQFASNRQWDVNVTFYFINSKWNLYRYAKMKSQNAETPSRTGFFRVSEYSSWVIKLMHARLSIKLRGNAVNYIQEH